MHKIRLIIRREYLSRVKKKSFLYVTFGVPFLIMAMMSLIVYLAINQGEKKKVVVIDESNWFAGKLKGNKNIEYTYSSNFPETKASFVKNGFDYLLHIPATVTNIQLFADKTPGAMNKSAIEDDINTVAHAHRLAEAHIDSAVLATAMKSVTIETRELTEKGEKNTHVVVAQVIGMLGAIVIYMAIFLYGAQVMRGVIEEKVSRIVEVIISSVKPFQLMMGKIIGVGMVGITQFILWIVLTMVLTSVGVPLLTGSSKESLHEMQTQQATAGAEMNSNSIGAILGAANSLPIAELVGCFLFFFVFGYLLYSALFAAVGSAVDSETETQQFMMPITLPLLFTFYISQFVIINNPDSALSFWLSIIPFTSPVAMMIRIPFGVPVWQLLLSMALMVLGFLGTTWFAGRIYRVGILMYGKKASYKELIKWFSYKE